MATYDINKVINDYFAANWTATPVQYQGQSLTHPKFVSLIYSPLDNEPYGFDGSPTGRIEYAGILKVFCYDTNPSLSMKLADDIKTFLNGKELLNNVSFQIGQDREAKDLGNGAWETVCLFNLSQWS